MSTGYFDSSLHRQRFHSNGVQPTNTSKGHVGGKATAETVKQLTSPSVPDNSPYTPSKP